MKKIPIIYWILSAAVLLLVIFGFWILNLKTEIEAVKKSQKIETAEKRRDSIAKDIQKQTDDFSEQSKSASALSSQIIKSIEYEKITVRDTAYDAMCRYIQNYRPN